ncbi:MAG: hypothetical protein H6619_06590 [Deltaproteobacteria bacterium]|nr:hypothetical protein [Deltaproteobacteria bacterium]
MNKKLIKYCLVGHALLLTGCSVLSSEDDITTDQPLIPLEEQIPTQTTSVPITEPVQKNVEQQEIVDEVRLTWKVPQDAVDGYLIHYGYSKNILTQRIKLKVSELQIVSDSNYGDVYKYILTNIPVNKTVYITISAIKDGVTSSPSSIIKLNPQK